VDKKVASERDQARWARARAVRAQAAVGAAVACPLCAWVTPDKGVELLAKQARVWPTGSGAARDRADALVADEAWRTPALAWVDGYNTAHGHGPTWREFVSEASLWPAGLPAMERHRVVPALWRAGHVDGAQTPFGLRARTPGQRAAFLKARRDRARTTTAPARGPVSAA
jgi:hypothetical protein